MNITSGIALIGAPFYAAYAAAKAGLDRFGEALRRELKGEGIHVLTIYPGGTDTPNEGSTTLSGVTFIEEQVSGTTQLYLPDAPDASILRRYDSLEAARMGLFNRCSQDAMIGYLARQALQGSVQSYLDAALFNPASMGLALAG